MSLQSRRSLAGAVALLAMIALLAVAGFQKDKQQEPGGSAAPGNRSFAAQSTAIPGALGDKEAVVEALRRDAVSSDTPLFAAQELAGASRRVAVSTGAFSSRSVFVGKSADGQVCLILQGKEIGGGGGCNSPADPFAGEAVWLSSNHVGGALPDELTIFGVAREGVKQVEVSVGGATASPSVSADGGFVVVLPGEQVGRGTLNVTVKAFGSSKTDALGTTSTQLHLAN